MTDKYIYLPRRYNYLYGSVVEITRTEGDKVFFRADGTEWHDHKDAFVLVKEHKRDKSRWKNAYEWLEEFLWKIEPDVALSQALELIKKIDPEEIYAVYQDQMEEDGYFEEEQDG